MKAYLKLSALALVLGLSLVGCNEATSQQEKTVNGQEASVQQTTTVIDVATFEKAIATPGVQLVDVRTDREWESGHIKGAEHFEMNNPTWQAQIATLDKSKPVYVYCAKGGRSARSAKQLEKAGFTTIYDLKGGITSWKAAGKSVE